MRSPRISRRDAWRRLVAAGPDDWVLRHSLAVEGLAAAMARRARAQGLDVDVDLVQAGALLHDVGRSVVHDVRHASIGAELLRQEEWPPRVVDIVERHTGAGIPADEAAALGLPVKDYTPMRLEEKIVAHADNLHSGDRRLSLEALRDKYVAKGLPHAWGRIQALHDELCRLLDADLQRLAPVALDPPGEAEGSSGSTAPPP